MFVTLETTTENAVLERNPQLAEGLVFVKAILAVSTLCVADGVRELVDDDDRYLGQNAPGTY